MSNNIPSHIPPSNSGDSTGRISNSTALSDTQRLQQRQFVADRVLKAIRHGITASFAYCTTHRMICSREVDGKGASYRDFANNLHGPPWNDACYLLQISNNELDSYLDSESEGRLSELYSAIRQLKEELDAGIAIREQGRRSHITEMDLTPDSQDSYSMAAAKRAIKRRQTAQSEDSNITEEVRHINIQETAQPTTKIYYEESD